MCIHFTDFQLVGKTPGGGGGETGSNYKSHAESDQITDLEGNGVGGGWGGIGWGAGGGYVIQNQTSPECGFFK